MVRKKSTINRNLAKELYEFIETFYNTAHYSVAIICAYLFCICFPQSTTINNAACDLAREVASEGDALVAGSLSTVACHHSIDAEGKGKEWVQEQFRKQCNVFRDKDVDFILAEVFLFSFNFVQ